MQQSQTDRDLEQGPVAIRAFRSLTRHHVEVVTQALAGCAAEWLVERHDDYDGYLSIMISATTAGADGPTFLISGNIEQIDLAELQGDALRQLGRFTAIEQLIPALALKCS